MKLTKGKINKLLHKKKQTRKKYSPKNKKQNANNKHALTFRRKNINLASKTLKNLKDKKIKGGQVDYDESNEMQETVTTNEDMVLDQDKPTIQENLPDVQNIQNIQNGFDAVSDAAGKISTNVSNLSQTGGKPIKKFRLTKRSRMKNILNEG
jgi:hypothetical protein